MRLARGTLASVSHSTLLMNDMTVLSRVVDSLGKAGPSPEPVPYMVEYLLDGNIVPSNDDLKAIDGLKAWHTVATPGGTNHLFTYWASKDHFTRDGHRLEKRLGTPATTQGLLGQAGTTAIPWWKRISLTTVVLSIAAVLGALEVISNRYDRLFAQPDLQVKTAPRFDAIEGAELASTLQVVNQVSTGHTNIVLAGELTSAGGQPQRVVLSANRIPELAGSTSKDIVAIVASPKAGQYKLRVVADASAGLMRSRKRFESDANVTVWPKLPMGAVELRQNHETNAVLAGTVVLGPAAPNGLDCALEVAKVSGLRFAGLFDMPVGHSNPSWHTAGEGVDSVAVLRWSIAPVLEGKQKLTLDVVLTRDGQTDWRLVASDTRLLCLYRKEKFRHD